MGRREKALKTKSLGMIILLLLMSFGSFAQSVPRLSLEQCMQEAMQKNGLLQTGQLEIQTAEALIPSGREVPKSTLDFQYGKTQTYFSQDYTVIANKNIPWPTQLRAQVSALTAQKMLAEKRLQVTQLLVKASVKWYYYQILFQNQQAKFLQKQDSMYTQMKRAAQLKFKEGETNRLELVAAESRLREFEQKMKALEMERKVSYQQLAYWINHPESFQISGLEKVKMTAPQKSKALLNNPQIQVLDQQVESGKLQVQVEREKLKPDLRIGVVSQSIENRRGQNFIQAGVGIPIFAKGQKAKIAASEKQVKVYESQRAQNMAQIQTELETNLAQLTKYQSALAYYETTALPQAEWLEKVALKSYQQGEIEYVEMLQNAQQAWQIREQYLQELLAHNQSIIQIETILGNE
jgi:cobalt-zinc-cadmium resistance protein CzcA